MTPDSLAGEAGSLADDIASRRTAVRSHVTLAVTICALAAGSAEAIQPRVGWEMGISRSSFSPSGDRGSFVDEGRWLPRVAFFASFALPGRVRMSPMLAYVERGATKHAQHPYFSESLKLRERSLAVGLQWGRPVLPRVMPALGLELTYLLDGEARGTYTGLDIGRVDYRYDYTSWGDRVDLLARLGLEVDLPAVRHTLVLHGRYVHGLREQNRAGGYSSGRNVAWTQGPSLGMEISKTRALEIGMGFRW